MTNIANIHDSKNLLQLNELSKSYEQTQAVNHINLNIHQGEIMAIVGPSGCGKSTLLKLIAGFERPDSGTIFLENQCINTLAPEKRHIGMVFQDYALFPNMKTLKNVMYALHQQKNRAHKLGLAKEYLSKLDMLNFAESYPHQLSGGQQQRVAIARTFASQPKLVLLDEPFSSIDESMRAHARQEIKSILRQSGLSVIMVTHDCEEALLFADRVCVMKEGTIQQIGTPEEIYLMPKNAFVAGFIGATNIFDANIEDQLLYTSLGVFSIENVKNSYVQLSIRPEELLLNTDCQNEAKIAVIINREFHGNSYLYSTQVAQDIVQVRCSIQQKYSLGQEVYIQPRSKDSLVILKESSVSQ